MSDPPPRVLVVEDNPTTRKLMRVALGGEGLQVDTAGTGADALARIRERVPDLVLLDLRLPDADGLELPGQLREAAGAPDLPIIACSGFISPGDELRVLSCGFTDYLFKPVEPSRVIETVRAYLTARSERRAGHPGRGHRVLLVDDDPIQLKLGRVQFQLVGFEVDTAPDGEAALERARSSPPDAIVSDVLMPRLDGFGLCLAVRGQPALASIPVVLVSNSYVESDDLAFARNAGASAFVVRSADFGAIIDATLGALQHAAPNPEGPRELLTETHLFRTVRQLERQVQANATLARRCGQLSTELSVIGGIAEALVRDRDIDRALHDVLTACLDAGGISLGVLYLGEPGGPPRVRAAVGYEAEHRPHLDDFFGDRTMLERLIDRDTPTELPESDTPARWRAEFERRGETRTALLVPLHGRREARGALLLGSNRARDPADWKAFGRGVAGQVTHAIELARAFAVEEGLRAESRAHADVLESVLHCMDEGVVVVDAGGEVVLRNEAADRFVGESFRLEQRTERWGDGIQLLDPERQTPIPPEALPIARALRGEPVDREQLVHLDARGVRRHLEATARPLPSSDGQRVMMHIRDVTEQRAMHARMMMADRMSSLGLLAAGVAHDINNPLATILANLQLIELHTDELNAEIGAEISESLEDAQHAVRRVSEITGDLQLLSQSDDTWEAVDVGAAIESALRLARAELQRVARVETELRPCPPVRGVPSRLAQVVLNLVVNAAHAVGETGRNGRIAVGLRPEDDVAIIEVRDDGAGIPRAIAERAFEPFVSTRHARGGTGLGLAIVARIVAGMDGTVDFDTGPEGTCFRVQLPLAPDELRPAPSPAPERPRSRVVVVADDRAVARTIARALAEHDVRAFDDPEAALAALQREAAPDAVVSDVVMQRLSGPALYEAACAERPALRDAFVFVAGATRAPQLDALREAGRPLVAKPVDPAAIRKAVNKVIRR